MQPKKIGPYTKKGSKYSFAQYLDLKWNEKKVIKSKVSCRKINKDNLFIGVIDKKGKRRKTKRIDTRIRFFPNRL